MITTSENDIVMSRKRLYDIVWAIEQLDIPEDNKPQSIMVRHILGELYEDFKLLRKSDARVARVEAREAKKVVEVVLNHFGGESE